MKEIGREREREREKEKSVGVRGGLGMVRELGWIRLVWC